MSCSGCQVSSIGRATMIRRAAVLILTLGLLAAPLAVQGQQAGKLYRVGYVSAASQESYEHLNRVLARAEGAWLDRGPKSHR